MDERARRVEPRSSRALGNEITTVRGELDLLLAELDRRRHEALDLRLQLRRHARGVALTGAAFAATAAGAVWLGLWRQRRRSRLVAQAGRLRHAVSRMIEQPERVAAEPGVAGKIAAAAGSALAASLVRKLLARGVDWLLERRRAAPARTSVPREARPAADIRKAA